jgi:hypothetical protein
VSLVQRWQASNMQGFIRLAGWGAGAIAALLIAVMAASSDDGRHRLATMFSGSDPGRIADAPRPEELAERAALLTRLATTEEDTIRLVEIVRSLSSDRELLLRRLSALERGLEDVTGSIKRQTSQLPLGTEPPPKVIATLPPVTAPPAASPRPEPAAPRATNTAPPGEPDARPAAGVDVGGAINFDGLRTLWSLISATHPELFEGLHPVVAAYENNRTRSADLRLVIGPLTDMDSATRICKTLASVKRYCRLVAFEGQPLAVVAPEPPPAAAPRRPVAAAPAPKAAIRPPAPVRP